MGWFWTLTLTFSQQPWTQSPISCVLENSQCGAGMIDKFRNHLIQLDFHAHFSWAGLLGIFTSLSSHTWDAGCISWSALSSFPSRL